MPLVLKAEPRAAIELSAAEQRIYDAYRQAFAGIGDINDSRVLRAIEDAINANNPLGAVNAVAWGDFAASLQKTVDALNKEVIKAANDSARTLPASVRIAANFTTADPRAIAFAEQRAGKLIRQVSDESRKAVSETVMEALRMRIDRREMVTRISKVVGLDSRQARALTRFYEKSLADGRAAGLDYDEALAKADRLGDKYKKRLIRQRAVRIARTETVAASNAGRYLSWIEADAQGLLGSTSVKRWITAIDERTCPICAPLNNKEVPYKTNFSTGELMPPVHPNCRCSAVIIPAEVSFIPLEKAVVSSDPIAAMLKHGTHDQSSHNPHKGGGRSEWSLGGMDYEAEAEELIAAGVMIKPLVDERGNLYYMGPSRKTDIQRKDAPIPEGYELDPTYESRFSDSNYVRVRSKELEKRYVRDNESGLTSLNSQYFYDGAAEELSKNPSLLGEIKDIEKGFLGIPTREALETHYSQKAKEMGLSGRNADYYVTGMTERTRTMITVNNDEVRFAIGEKLVKFVPAADQDYFAQASKTRSTVVGNLQKGFPVVAIEEDDFLSVIKDGRFKTQYETKESNGAYKPYTRRTNEMAYMGVPQDTPAGKRPIYGYVASQVSGTTPNTSPYNTDKWNINNSGVGQYGEVRVVMNDDVIGRTSYTIPDSLDGYALARPLGEAHTERSVAQAGIFHDIGISHNGFQRESYAEAQIRGGVSLKDIKEVYIVGGKPESIVRIQTALAGKGVDIPVKTVPYEVTK